MKLFVIFALVAVAMAKPSAVFTPTFYAAAPLVAPVGTLNTLATAPVVSQYHSQDELGQYSYGYNGGSSAKSEIKSLDGVTRGAYSYVDAEGKLQSVEYTADAMNGFRATSSNMPVAPIETRTAPLPVQETAEVAKARADHMVAFEEAKVRAAAEPEMEEARLRKSLQSSRPRAFDSSPDRSYRCAHRSDRSSPAEDREHCDQSTGLLLRLLCPELRLCRVSLPLWRLPVQLQLQLCPFRVARSVCWIPRSVHPSSHRRDPRGRPCPC